MGKLSLAVLASFITSSVCAQVHATQKKFFHKKMFRKNTAYSIHAQITPYKNCRIYLGTYYGKNKILADSAWVNGAGEATFEGNKKLAQGIYFFVSPDHTLLFEILMDKTQHFSVRADSAHLENIAVEGSPENKLFADYTRYLAAVSPKMNKLQQAYRKSKTAQDSTLYQTELKQMSDSLTAYRNNIIKNHPTSMLTLFFRAVKKS